MNTADSGRGGSSTGSRIGRTMVALLSTVALGVTGYAYMTLDGLKSDMSTTSSLSDIPGAPDEDDGAVDILLVGTDARTDAQGNPLSLKVLKKLRTEAKDGINTDTLIILRMPKDGSEATAVSIPRDTWVRMPDGSDAKINSAFNTAKVNEMAELAKQPDLTPAERELASDDVGRVALVQTVQEFTNVRLDHYAEVSLLGFYLLTEALGGVEVCLNHDTQDKDAAADFKAGRHKVSGGDALSFVRQRKNLPRGDLDRIVRQQVFLASALDKVLSAGTLTSPRRLGELTDAIKKSVVLDPDMDILQFAEKAKTIASGDVEFVTIPVVNINGRSQDGRQSIVEVEPEDVRKFLARLSQARSSKESSGGGGAVGGLGGGVGSAVGGAVGGLGGALGGAGANGPVSGGPVSGAPVLGADKPISGDNVPCVN